MTAPGGSIEGEGVAARIFIAGSCTNTQVVCHDILNLHTLKPKNMAGVVKHKMASHAWPFIPCMLHLRELSCYAGVCGAVHIQTSCIHLPAHSYSFNLSGRSCVQNQRFRQIATGIAHIGTCIKSLKRSLVAPMNFLEST